MSQQKKSVSQILLPSWLSGVFICAASVIFVLTIVGVANYNGSEFQLLRDAQASHAVSNNYQALDSQFTNTWVSNIPLLIFWAGVGLLAYSFVMRLTRSFAELEEIRHEMDYVHANRRAIIRETLGHLLIRIVVLAIWLLFVKLTIAVLLPYTTALAYVAEGFPSFVHAAGYLLADVLLVTVILHMHIVLLRMLLLKSRVFGGFDYT